MSVVDQSTQQRILDAALEEFHRQGFKGARTTRIAERAGMSRTMLHYYFSTKEALFEAVLNKTFGAVMPHLHRLVLEEKELPDLVDFLVEVVADMLEEHPSLPNFVVNILSENPQLILNLTAFQQENTPGQLDQALLRAKATGQVRPDLRGEDLLLDIWALCSTPYLLAPYIAAKEKRDPEAMRLFIRNRRNGIKKTILNGAQITHSTAPGT
jgi:AcrR family transcriptional regulator